MFKFNFLFNNIFYSDGYKILTLFNLFILRHLLRLSATFNIFYLTFVLYLEFLCTGFVLSFVFIKWYGLLSKVIKFLISKINYHSIKWWIKCLLLFLVILTIGIFSTNIVYLDFNSTFVQVLDNSVTVKISGDLIKDIINHIFESRNIKCIGKLWIYWFIKCWIKLKMCFSYIYNFQKAL